MRPDAVGEALIDGFHKGESRPLCDSASYNSISDHGCTLHTGATNLQSGSDYAVL